MSFFELEVCRGYEHSGQYFSQAGWDNYCLDKGLIEADKIYTTTDPIRSTNIEDVIKCSITDAVIGSQYFSESSAYDQLLEVYLTVISTDFAKDIRLAAGLVSPDTMYTMMLINHPEDGSPKCDNFDIMANILTTAKVQLALSEYYRSWSDAITSEKPIDFMEFCKFAESWEDLTGDEGLLDCLANKHRPKNPALLVDFVDSRTRIFRMIDQLNYEFEIQGKSYSPEDVGESFEDLLSNKDLQDPPSSADRNPENDDIWKSFIDKNIKNGWLPFGGQDFTDPPKPSSDDDFNSGLDDEDFK